MRAISCGCSQGRKPERPFIALPPSGWAVCKDTRLRRVPDAATKKVNAVFFIESARSLAVVWAKKQNTVGANTGQRKLGVFTKRETYIERGAAYLTAP